MFVDAIAKAMSYIRPVFLVDRKFNSKSVSIRTATIIFVNKLGYAITTLDAANIMHNSGTINNVFARYKEEKSQLINLDELKLLNEKYGYTEDAIVESYSVFGNCFDSFSSFQTLPHGSFNLALIKFEGFKDLKYSGYAKFHKGLESPKIGEHLCRLGFPFSGINENLYNEELDQIDLNLIGNISTSFFPLEGIVLQQIYDNDDKIVGLEINTPGFQGHEGGPLFDQDSIIHGIHTNNRLVSNNNLHEESISIKYPPALFGECLNSQTIREFLFASKVPFYDYENGVETFNDNYTKEEMTPTLPYKVVSYISTDDGEYGIQVSARVQIGDKVIFDSQTPVQLTTGKVDSNSRKAGSAMVEFSTKGDNLIYGYDEGSGRTSLLGESKIFKLGVNQKEFKTKNWKVKAKIGTQNRAPFEYFDLQIFDRNKSVRDHVKDPHIAFLPDGSGKYIRIDNEKGIKVNTTKIIEQAAQYILPQETLIQSDDFDIKLIYIYNDETLSIDKFEVTDKVDLPNNIK